MGFIDDMVKKYSKDLAKKEDPFEKRLAAYEKFHDPDEDNLGKLADEAQGIIKGDGKSTFGIRGIGYEKIDKLFDYDPGKRKAGKKNLSKKEVEEFLDAHIYEFVKAVAAEDLDTLKKEFKDDKEGFKKSLETLYDSLTGRGQQQGGPPGIKHKKIIEQLGKLDYRSFRDMYDSNMLTHDVNTLTGSARDYITDHLIQPYDRIKLGSKVKVALKDHGTYEASENPLHTDSQTNANTYLGLKVNPNILQVKADDLIKNFNLKVKKKAKKKK